MRAVRCLYIQNVGHQQYIPVPCSGDFFLNQDRLPGCFRFVLSSSLFSLSIDGFQCFMLFTFQGQVLSSPFIPTLSCKQWIMNMCVWGWGVHVCVCVLTRSAAKKTLVPLFFLIKLFLLTAENDRDTFTSLFIIFIIFYIIIYEYIICKYIEQTRIEVS